ncbi:hypothetical protein ANN_19114 [Periplaneta americana]|uniref:Uncharacterized protein n=1 Tax=Periplaneta americana TaxID=6978 RepID=A0ABQ8S904_PERAM|nr:hypothetical protein ANN_19114 [Periplaneta americana]
MADQIEESVESALKSLLNVPTEGKNLGQDLKQDIVKAVSTLRECFHKLKIELGRKSDKIRSIQAELENVREQLQTRERLTISAPSKGVSQEAEQMVTPSSPQSAPHVRDHLQPRERQILPVPSASSSGTSHVDKQSSMLQGLQNAPLPGSLEKFEQTVTPLSSQSASSIQAELEDVREQLQTRERLTSSATSHGISKEAEQTTTLPTPQSAPHVRDHLQTKERQTTPAPRASSIGTSHEAKQNNTLQGLQIAPTLGISQEAEQTVTLFSSQSASHVNENENLQNIKGNIEYIMDFLTNKLGTVIEYKINQKLVQKSFGMERKSETEIITNSRPSVNIFESKDDNEKNHQRETQWTEVIQSRRQPTSQTTIYRGQNAPRKPSKNEPHPGKHIQPLK